jgi:hypothetical protein
MSETRIKIKELEMNGETAIRIVECLKKHEPEIWKVLSDELKKALSINDESIDTKFEQASDFDYDEDDFQCCDKCDLPDACADFGCAIKSGVKKVLDL